MMKKNYISPEFEELSVLSSDILLASTTEEFNDTIIDTKSLFE